MTDLYSSTVPPAVLQKLRSTAPTSGWHRDAWIAEQAAQWGADQELEACCEWFKEFYKTESWVKHDLKHFRAARRPKSPSLKEQALEELNLTEDSNGAELSRTQVDLIRRALEALPE
jgi:hypothetical protein